MSNIDSERKENVCHICGKPAEYICRNCDECFCDDCGATYNQFTQIDYDCCKSCEQNIKNRDEKNTNRN